MQIEPTEWIATIEMTADEASTMRSLGGGETEMIEILSIWLVEIRRSGGTEMRICHHHPLVHLYHETTSRLLEVLLLRETRTSRNVAHQQPSSSIVAAIQRNGMDPEMSETASLNVVNANDVDIEMRLQQHWLEQLLVQPPVLLLTLAQKNPLPLTMPVQNPVV
jgi:hypothetical protein